MPFVDVFRWEARPTGLREPVLIGAFKGWNDAGEAASFATSYLGSALGATRFASVDPEGFFDFQSHRPRAVITDGTLEGHFTLPNVELYSAAPAEGRSVILVTGSEPSMRWPTLCRAALATAVDLGVREVITLGSLIADVPHTRPVRISHMASPRDMTDSLGTRRPDYQGPTGIVTMLHQTAVDQNLRAASIWAAVPHYVGAAPAPNATLALLRAIGAVTGLQVDLTDLETAVAAFESEVDEAVKGNSQATNLVSELEQAYDRDLQPPGEDLPTGDAIAAEFERYLRDRAGDDEPRSGH